MIERLFFVAVIFLAGFAQGFQAGTWRGLDAVAKVEETSSEAVAFADAAQDANGWDYIFNKEK